MRRFAGGAFCRRGDFAADGGVSDFDQRNRDDAFPRRGGTTRADTFGILASRVWSEAAAHRAGNFGRRGAFDGGRRFSGAVAKSARRSVCVGRFERSGAGSHREFGNRAPRAGLDSARGICRGGSDDHCGLFSRADAADNSTAPRCCWRESFRRRFCRRSSCF